VSFKFRPFKNCLQGPVGTISNVHNYLKEKFQVVDEIGRNTMNDALGLLAATFGIYYPNEDTAEDGMLKRERKLSLEEIKKAINEKLRNHFHF
jgi:uncharacterized protein (UPF0297 family)